MGDLHVVFKTGPAGTRIAAMLMEVGHRDKPHLGNYLTVEFP